MTEKFDAVDFRKYGGGGVPVFIRQGNGVGIKPCGVHGSQVPGKALVLIPAFESQGFEHGVLQLLGVSIFAKNHRQDQPMIGRADRTVLPVKPLESPAVPLFGRGRRPCGRWIGLLVIGGPVDEVIRVDSLTLADRLGGLSDQNAVHVRRISNGKVAGG